MDLHGGGAGILSVSFRGRGHYTTLPTVLLCHTSSSKIKKGKHVAK